MLGLLVFVAAGASLAMGLIQIPLTAFNDRVLLALLIGLVPVSFMTSDTALRYFALWTMLAGVGGVVHIAQISVDCLTGGVACTEQVRHRAALAFVFYAVVGISGALYVRRAAFQRSATVLPAFVQVRLLSYWRLINRGVSVEGFITKVHHVADLNVDYRYRANGREYVSEAHCYSPEEGPNRPLENTRVEVCYDPRSPETSVLGSPRLRFRDQAISVLLPIFAYFLLTVCLWFFAFHRS